MNRRLDLHMVSKGPRIGTCCHQSLWMTQVYILEDYDMEPENHWFVEEASLSKVHDIRCHIDLLGCIQV